MANICDFKMRIIGYRDDVKYVLDVLTGDNPDVPERLPRVDNVEICYPIIVDESRIFDDKGPMIAVQVNGQCAYSCSLCMLDGDDSFYRKWVHIMDEFNRGIKHPEYADSYFTIPLTTLKELSTKGVKFEVYGKEEMMGIAESIVVQDYKVNLITGTYLYLDILKWDNYKEALFDRECDLPLHLLYPSEFDRLRNEGINYYEYSSIKIPFGEIIFPTTKYSNVRKLANRNEWFKFINE